MVPVLVIDHDKERLADTTAVLSRHGYCPLAARFDSDALSLLDDMPIEVALVEYQPARPEHAALIGSIRRHHPHVALIALTDDVFGRARAQSTLRALDVAAVVHRPFPPAALINAVGHHLLDALAA